MIQKKKLLHAITLAEKQMVDIEPQRWKIKNLLPVGLEPLKHAKWMCSEAKTLVSKGKYRRAAYYLGVVHATLWRYGRGNLTDLEDLL